MILVNKIWLLAQFFGQKINIILIFLKVKKIGTLKHESTQFVKVFLFLLSKNKIRQPVYILFICKLYLVKSFWVNILVENNVLSPKSFVLNIRIDYAIIRSCGVMIPIKARQQDQFLNKELFIKDNEIMFFCFKTMIPLLLVPLSNDKDFLFHLSI